MNFEISENGIMNPVTTFEGLTRDNIMSIYLDYPDYIQNINITDRDVWVEFIKIYSGTTMTVYDKVEDGHNYTLEDNPKGIIITFKVYFTKNGEEPIITSQVPIQIGIMEPNSSDVLPNRNIYQKMINRSFCDYAIVGNILSFYNVAGAKISEHKLDAVSHEEFSQGIIDVKEALAVKVNRTDFDAIKNNTVNIANDYGGFAAGAYAQSNEGIAIGGDAYESSRSVAIHNSAYATDNSIAIGDSAYASSWSAAIHNSAYATDGGIAIGNNATGNEEGIAIGYGAQAYNGAPDGGAIAIGVFAESAGNGVAIGTDSHVIGSCIQLGDGYNQTYKTLKVYDYTLLDQNGNIPAERLKNASGSEITYRCNGSGDIIAINNIINNFFIGDPEEVGCSMNLNISGTTIMDGDLNIYTSSNPGNKICRIDFSNCNITVDDSDWDQWDRTVNITSSVVRVILVGLKWYGYGAMIGLNLYVSTANTACLINLLRCKIAALSQGSAASTVKWNIKGCRFASSSIKINNVTVTATTADILNDYVYFRRYDNLFNQTIT